MDGFVSQVFNVILSWGPGGILALIAAGWGWNERNERREVQDKYEKALADWKEDIRLGGAKAESLLDKSVIIAEAFRDGMNRGVRR